jgi:hypothetical protein
MGGIECTSLSRDTFLMSIIERKLENKDTSLDKKIHNDYLNIIGINHFKFDENQVYS